MPCHCYFQCIFRPCCTLGGCFYHRPHVITVAPVSLGSKRTNRVVFYKQVAAWPFAKLRIENIIFTREPYIRNSLSYLTFSCGVLMLSICFVMSKSSSKTTPRSCAAISSSRIHGEQDSRFHKYYKTTKHSLIDAETVETPAINRQAPGTVETVVK